MARNVSKKQAWVTIAFGELFKLTDRDLLCSFLLVDNPSQLELFEYCENFGKSHLTRGSNRKRTRPILKLFMKPAKFKRDSPCSSACNCSLKQPVSAPLNQYTSVIIQGSKPNVLRL